MRQRLQAYWTIREIAKLKGIDWRVAKKMIWNEIIEISKNNPAKKEKKKSYVLFDDLLLLIVEKLKWQNK
jgi:hypothetical protein